MRIAVNAACLRQDLPADTGSIITNLVLALCRQHAEHQFTLFFDGDLPAGLILPVNAKAIQLPIKGSKAWHLYWWLEWQLPRAMKSFCPDLLLSVDALFPLRGKVPAGLLLSDTSFLKNTGTPATLQHRYLKRNIKKYLERAESIAVLTETSREKACRYVAKDKIVRLDTGVSRVYQPLYWEQREKVKKTFTGGVEYFLVIASIHPENHIFEVLKAFSMLKRRQRSNIRLILAGSLMPEGTAITAALPTYKFRQDLVCVDKADEVTLARLIGAAYALIYLSGSEKLAMPIYAAQRCEVPVIAIDSVSAREAGGDTALYAAPGNVEELFDKMSLLYKDEQLRSMLLSKVPPVKTFDGWDGPAEQLWTQLAMNKYRCIY